MSESESIPFDSLGSDQIRFVLVKTAWTNPGQEAKLHFQIIAAERTIDLAELQQAIQDDFEAHATEDHPGATMTVEVWDAAHVPEGVIPEGAEVTSSVIWRKICQEQGHLIRYLGCVSVNFDIQGC